MSLISTIISSSIPRSPKIDEIDASGSAVSDRSDNELFIRGNSILIVDAISVTRPKLTSVWWWVGWWADHTIGIAQENMLQLALTHNEAFVSGRLTTTRDRWLNDQTGHRKNVLLSWYLQLFGVLASSVIKTTMEKVKPELVSASWVPLLRLLFPKTEKSNLNRRSTSFINASDSGVKW
ncbi:hypothetical protein OIU77_013631 [Salix suchowensis]|uniref:Uncharacterized protein n=1 Tax=Salix suchowensis TaxID=1278906 RepID=A0ABQ8ZUX9_9ROSI|nr:hypothetical protein OIU77_013631 [Salix suchowensis]